MIDYLNINDIDINTIISKYGNQVREKGYSMNRKARSRIYKDCIMAFDIETTTIDEIEQSIMYIWQLQIEDITIIGRTWDEFYKACKDITRDLKKNEFFVIFVHNLSFEFQWLSDVFRDTLKNVFCMDSRKVLKFEILDHIEFRCSYLHSNMSLEQYTKKMNVKDFKLSGDIFDYSIKRYPWDDFDKFKDYEKRYILNDVKGLVQAIHKDMETSGDNLYSFVLTSTGLCRRDTKKVLTTYKKYIRRLLPGLKLLTLFREGFRGGDVHGNRFYSGHIIYERMKGMDITSSYPKQLYGEPFPMSPFKEVKNKDFDRIIKFIKTGRYAYIMRVLLTDVYLLDDTWGIPYIAKAKCQYIENGIYDNGRVLQADELMITITDIDLKILVREYHFDIEILEAYKSKYDYLPDTFRQLILGYYESKTQLKDVEGMEIYYAKSKALLNALYGMCAQNPLRPTIEYAENDFFEKEQKPEAIVENYNHTAFLPYQWGVWCTAYARKQLHDGIHYIVDHGGVFVYSDTDSIKYFGDVDLSGLNDPIKAAAEKSGAYAQDIKGRIHYLGVWEDEYKEPLKEFIHLGAKKYAYRDSSGKLHITVAGVSKSKGAEELEEMGGLSAFKIGTVFKRSGGNEVIYNDENYGLYTIDGHTINVIKNIVIKPSFYTLGITNEYQKLIHDFQLDYI